MKRVVIESPYAGGVAANVEYAKRAVRDSLLHGEAPIASHLLFTQPDLLDDDDDAERKLGMCAGHAWIPCADLVVAYLDRGVSAGMKAGLDAARRAGVPIVYRRIEET